MQSAGPPSVDLIALRGFRYLRQLGNDRSTQDPPSPFLATTGLPKTRFMPADEARVLRVTLSTLLPLTTSVAWAVSEAPYIGGSLPPDAQSSCSP